MHGSFQRKQRSLFSILCFLFPILLFGYIFVSNPDFQVFTFCSQSMFFVWSRFFIQVFWFSVFIPVSDPSFFGLISVPNSGFLVFWIHLFSRFPIHISAAQSTAILRLITWVFNQKMPKIDILDALGDEMTSILKTILTTNPDNTSWQSILTNNLDMPGICLKHAEICIRYSWNMPEIPPRYAQDMPKICPRYAQEMRKICLIHDQDMPKIYLI